MSQNLHWRRADPKRAKTLGCGLKWAIEKKFGHGPHLFTSANLDYLEGIRDGHHQDDETAKDAQTLIDAIETSEAGVEVWIE